MHDHYSHKKDCIILYDLYHDDCADALSDEVNKKFGFSEDTQEGKLRDKMFEFVKALGVKYKGRNVLKLL